MTKSRRLSDAPRPILDGSLLHKHAALVWVASRRHFEKQVTFDQFEQDASGPKAHNHRSADEGEGQRNHLTITVLQLKIEQKQFVHECVVVAVAQSESEAK